MPFKRILVLQSVEDAITERRKQKITNDPMLKEYEFAFGYAVELSDEQKRMRIPEMVSQVANQPFDADGFLRRLTQQICEFHPDLIVIHRGFVFKTFWEEIVPELKLIRLQFPEIILGLHQFEQAAPEVRQVFDNTAEIQALVEIMFAFEKRRLPFPNLTVPFSQN